MEGSNIQLEENENLDENEAIPQYSPEDFVNGILDEMKSKFNSEDITNNITIEEKTLTEAELNISKSKCNKQKGQRPVESVKFAFDKETPSYSKDGDRRHESSPKVIRNKVKEPIMQNIKNIDVCKTSNRRRSSHEFSESVVQNAIARKEQSFSQNVTTQIKRPSRPLKPTQKVLDNMAAASQKRESKIKSKSFEEAEANKKASAKRLRNSPKSFKKIKFDETESGSFNSDDDSLRNLSKSPRKNDTQTRRSKRISSVTSKKDDESTKSSSEKFNISNIDSSSDTLSAFEELIFSRVCLCTQNTDVFITKNEDIVYCDALDSIDGKVVGCSRTLNSKQVSAVRPSLRIPYSLYCKMHRERLKSHNCCPTCGIFCTQGTFSECVDNHQYHPECHLNIGEDLCCPHCGLAVPTKTVKLVLECDQTVINDSCYIHKQRLKISSANQNSPNSNHNNDVTNQISNTANNLKKSILTCQNIQEANNLCNVTDVKMTAAVKTTDTDTDIPSKRHIHLMFNNSMKSNDSPVVNPKKKMAARYNNPLEEVSSVTNLIPIHNLEQQTNDDIDLFAISETILHENYTHLRYLLDSATVDGQTSTDLSLPFMYAHHLSPTTSGTILHYACALGRMQAVHMIMNKYCHGSSNDLQQLLQLMDSDLNTPLAVALTNRNNECARILLESGVCSITARGADGMSPLHAAARSGNVAGCELLLHHAAHAHHHSTHTYLNSADDGGWTALIWASEHAHADVVALLLARGADRTRRDIEHNMAVHWACYAGHVHVLNVLLDTAGCPSTLDMINAVNIQGDTPLHLAAHQGHTPCILQLLAHGAEPAIYNKMHETPLDLLGTDIDSDAYRTIAKYLRHNNNKAVNCEEQLGRGDSGVAEGEGEVKEITQPPKRGTNLNGLKRWGKQILLNSDISRGRELNPIQLVNHVDSTPEAVDYCYVTSCCLTTDNVRIDTRITSLRHCNCSSDGIVSCLTYLHDDETSRCQCLRDMKLWYDMAGRLVKGFNFQDPPAIFECNDLCSCNSLTCGNRVVQKNGSLMNDTIRTQVFRTRDRGWALRTLRNIAQGSYVCEYVGEVLTDRDVNLRADDSYVFDLDNMSDSELYCIDARFYGNMSRFINHSCQPNLVPVKVFTNHQDLRFPRIAFFANRHIRANNELSFDYGEKFWTIKCKSFTCECGSEICKYSKDTIAATLEQCRKSAQTAMATCNGQ